MTKGPGKTRADLESENRQLRLELERLKTQRAFSRGDRLKLAIVDRMPLSMWACDREYKIVLWAGGSSEIYGFAEHDVLGKEYLGLFVDEPERDDSRRDCLRIIDHDVVFRNFLAQDMTRDKSSRVMCTNCFRIFDEDKQEWLQAEVGLNIGDLELSKERHRTLRELGIRLVAERSRSLEVERNALIGRVYTAQGGFLQELGRRQEELVNYKRRLSEGMSRSVLKLSGERRSVSGSYGAVA